MKVRHDGTDTGPQDVDENVHPVGEPRKCSFADFGIIERAEDP